MSDYVKMVLLRVDLGFGAVEAATADLNGAPLGQGWAAYQVREPAPERAEADPGDWWLAIVRATREALKTSGDVEIVGLTVAAQLAGIVLVDDRGAVLRPALLCRDLYPSPGPDPGSGPDPYPYPYPDPGPGPYPGSALAWLATREPHTLRAAWRVLQPAAWLRLRLTGSAAPDPARLLPGPAAALGLRPGIPVTTGTGPAGQPTPGVRKPSKIRAGSTGPSKRGSASRSASV